MSEPLAVLTLLSVRMNVVGAARVAIFISMGQDSASPDSPYAVNVGAIDSPSSGTPLTIIGTATWVLPPLASSSRLNTNTLLIGNVNGEAGPPEPQASVGASPLGGNPPPAGQAPPRAG